MSAPRGSGGRFGGAAVRLGRVAGAPVYVSWSTALLLALITAIYGSIADTYSAELSGGAGYLAAAAFALLLGASILLHEIGHALVGRALGLEVHRIELDLLGGGTRVSASRRPREEFAVAVIGPIVNIVLAAGALLAALNTPAHSAVWTIALWSLWGNASVAILNLLPGLPLDGGRVLSAGIWAITGDYARAMTVAAWIGRAVAVLLAVLGVLQQASGRGAALGLPLLLFVALYMWMSASGVLRWAAQERALRALTPARMVRPIALLARRATVREAIERARAAGALAVGVIDDQMRVSALLTDDRLGVVPREQWDEVRIGQLPVQPMHVLPGAALADMETLREALSRDAAPDYLVLDSRGAVGGHLRTRDLLDAARGSRQAGPP